MNLKLTKGDYVRVTWGEETQIVKCVSTFPSNRTHYHSHILVLLNDGNRRWVPIFRISTLTLLEQLLYKYEKEI